MYLVFAGGLKGEHLCQEGNRLSSLMLRANNFTGPLNLTGCTNLTVLDLQVGGFCGAVGARVQLWS
jgi:hypothetical protein